jgi:phosphodiesterase/alkaline phosphatase D-like protein
LTTNPTVEGWGHFPHERQRLLRLLGRGISGLVVFSGDVHHAEILDPIASLSGKKRSFLEITSSGMTHECSQPFYGAMCRPILEHYNQHRYLKNPKDNPITNIYIGKNYGTLSIDWEAQTAKVLVKNELGDVVLSTGDQSFQQEALSQEEIDNIAPCVDGHLVRPFLKLLVALLGILLIGTRGLFFSSQK